jgi:mono/diheme cytochrome c family protein
MRAPFVATTICLAGFALAMAQQATVRVGAYTVEQAKAGEAAYKANCASCHGDDLEGKGRNTPGLLGDEFLNGWRELPVADLFDKIQDTMPGDKPGKLTREQNAAILAYVFQMNKLPAGAAPLPSDKAGLAKLAWK